MKRRTGTQSSALLLALSIGALSAICLPATPAGAQYPAEAQYVPPPPEVVATLVPVYHEGRATYWYNGRWHYRDARGAWGYYREEPGYLRDYRGHRRPEYHRYGRR